jgi:hypothetical protein
MSLAARWISSPLPYQLGLALHKAESSAGVRDRLSSSDPHHGTCGGIGIVPLEHSGVILTALGAPVNNSFTESHLPISRFGNGRAASILHGVQRTFILQS